MTAAELRRLREQLGWEQIELAKAIGVAANIVGRWERDERQIPEMAGRLIKLLAAQQQRSENTVPAAA